MAKGIFILGTDTSVGKTVISAALMKIIKENKYHCCYFKPILSGATQ